MFANVLGLSIPNAIIRFWYAEADKVRLSWTFVLVLSISQVAVGLVLAYPIYMMYGDSFGQRKSIILTIAGFVFAAAFNFNTFLTGVCRARNWSKGYFAAQVIAGLTLVVGVFLLSHWSRLEILIGLFLASIISQDAFLAGSVWRYLRSARLCFDRRIARELLRYSVPMLPHAEAVLFSYWVDKYVVRQYFSPLEFSRYTISFQYAFAQAFFAQVFAMHTFPLVCKLVAEANESKLRVVIRSYNFLLIVAGASWIALVLLLQAVGVRLNVDPVGFALIGTAFLVWNVAGNYINTLWARCQTLAVTGVMLGSTLILVMVLGLGCGLHRLLICYSSHLACATVAMLALIALEHSQVRRAQTVELQAHGGASTLA